MKEYLWYLLIMGEISPGAYLNIIKLLNSEVRLSQAKAKLEGFDEGCKIVGLKF
jgi:hypothetical protein